MSDCAWLVCRPLEFRRHQLRGAPARPHANVAGLMLTSKLLPLSSAQYRAKCSANYSQLRHY